MHSKIKFLAEENNLSVSLGLQCLLL